MSKSMARVEAALEAAGLGARIIEPGPSRTAQEAANACGCALDQIVKSLIFQGESGKIYLFLTAGGNQIDAALATEAAGEPLQRADAAVVRSETGFAIGGVAPLGHLKAPVILADPRLLAFTEVFAAAGTPRHVFAAEPRALLDACGARLARFTVGAKRDATA
ncbi:MAG: YbaK/EbsC family protein [Pararhodobacter sp.]